MDEEQFVCQSCGHHEADELEEGENGMPIYECLNCFSYQDTLSGSREEE